MRFKEIFTMNNNERITIKPLQNGYLVEKSWRERNAKSEDVFDYNYVEEQFMFATWDEVVTYISTNKMDVPPQKI